MAGSNGLSSRRKSYDCLVIGAGVRLLPRGDYPPAGSQEFPESSIRAIIAPFDVSLAILQISMLFRCSPTLMASIRTS
jgi:hypothetical protein